MKNMKCIWMGATLAFTAATMPALAETLEVSGATTVQRRILEPGAQALNAATGLQLRIYGPGTGKGMLALIDGRVPVAAAGESLADAIESAKAAAQASKRELKVPPDLTYFQVADDNIAIAVHASNPVKSLSKQQVKAIMTGKVKNWKEVGGPDLPIQVYAAAPDQAVRGLVQKGFLDGEAYGPDATSIRTANEQLGAVGITPGGIAAMSEPVIRVSTEKVRVVPGAVVARPLGFVTIGKPSPSVQKMIDYFRSPQGQKGIR